MSVKIKRNDQTFKMLNKFTGHLIWLLTNDDDKTDTMKEFNNAMVDPFQNIKDYITDRVSFPNMFRIGTKFSATCHQHTFPKIWNKGSLQVECNWDAWGWKGEYWSNCSLWTVLCLLQTVHQQFWWIHSFHLQVGGFTADWCRCVLWDILKFQGKIENQNGNSSSQPTCTSMYFDPAIYKS